MDATILCIIIG